MTRVQTPVLELNWSELEVVVAGEGGHCVSRGPPPVWCVQHHTPARLHLNDWTEVNQLKAPNNMEGARMSTGEEQPVQFELYICSL